MDDLEKMKNDINKTIGEAKTELENAKAEIETSLDAAKESAKKNINRLTAEIRTREQEKR